MEEKVIDIQELAQDSHNFNKGNEQGQQLMERSFKELGAGRSILLDRNGNIIAGNKSQQAAIAAGIKKVRVIETTGDELVAVKRTDVDIDSAEGRKMAYLDTPHHAGEPDLGRSSPLYARGRLTQGLRHRCMILILPEHE